MFNLIHLANFNSTNIGNGALIHGLESTLQEDLPVDINWQREAWDDYTFGRVDFDREFVDKVNASDGLLVGGAVTFNGRDYNKRTGTRFELPYELWSDIDKPVIFYGLSYRHWQGQEYHNLDKLRFTIEKIVSTDNMLLSVRNDGTKKWLEDVAGIKIDIAEVPDPAVYVTAKNDNYYPEFIDDVQNVIIAFNDEDSALRFDPSQSRKGKTDNSREHVIDELVKTVQLLAENHEVNFILCPHYFDDYKMMSDFIERVPPKIAHQLMVSSGLCRVKDTGYFYGRYKQASMSISMRVHSMSPCIGLGTPMITYSTQDRMTNFMERIGLKDMVVDAFQLSSGDLLYERADFALNNKNIIRERFKQVRSTLRKQTLVFHEQINGLLNS